MTRPIFDEPLGNKSDPRYQDRSKRWLDGARDIKTGTTSEAYRVGFDRIDWSKRKEAHDGAPRR